MDEKDALEVGNEIHEDLLKYAEDRMKVLLVGEDSSARLSVMRALLAAQKSGLGIVIVGAGHSAGLFSGRGPSTQNIPTESYLMDIEEREVLRGRKVDLTIFDEWETIRPRPIREWQPEPELPADKRKGPKGPRTKWGKLK